MHHPPVLATVTAVLAALPATHGFYTKSSPVLQVDARSYDKLIAKSNHTSIVEFFAPWCGHCKNLKPAYEKAATQLQGLAKVAAVDCDEEPNKAFCGSMGVQGFPTLKIVRPSKKPGGKPVVEDYQGPRTASGIAQAVSDKINNHVTRVTDKDADAFLAGANAKLLLFSDKGTTSALLRSLAIDFLDVISVGQVRDTSKQLWEKFGVTDSPKLVLIPGEGADPVVYEGEIKDRKKVVEFLSQVGEPNPDPAPAKAKKGRSKSKEAEEKPVKKTEEKPAPEESPDASEPKATSGTAAPAIVPITSVASYDTLAETCLQPKSSTCVLAFVPEEASSTGDLAIASLSQLNTKYIHGKRHLFPFFSVPANVDGTAALKGSLELSAGVELVAINARRGWLRQYSGDFGAESIEAWIDAIRMGDGEKKKLPKDILSEVTERTTEAASTEETSAEATQATDPEPEVETETSEPEEIKHEEL